jgi:hypothetical protein
VAWDCGEKVKKATVSVDSDLVELLTAKILERLG